MSIKGDKIELGPVLTKYSDEKYSNYLYWMANHEVIKYLESRFYPQTPEKLVQYVTEMNSNPNVVFFSIIEPNLGGNHIGNIKLLVNSWIHRFGEVGLVIDQKYWGKGYGTEAISLVKDYAFTTLNLHKVWAGCYTQNTGSIKAFQKAGFEIEYEIKNQYQLDGVYTDDIVLSAFNPKETR